MDIWFYWVQYRICQGQYNLSCKPVVTNLAYYFTNHNSPHHHRHMHPLYINCPGILNNSSERVCYSIQNTSLK